MAAEPRRRRVAVTGASGYLGGVVVRHLRARGCEVFAFGQRPVERVDPDLRGGYASWDIAAGPLDEPPSVDAVVHCAGKVSDWGTDDDFEQVNVIGTRSVVATWPDVRIVHISTASIYNDHRAGVLHERDADPADRTAIDAVDWLSAYGRSKRLAEYEVASRATDWAILRPHAIYGPDDTQLVPRVVARMRRGRLVLPGDGRTTRISMVHVDNLVHAIDRALDSDEVGAFNIVDAITPTVHEAVTAAFAAIGVPVRIVYAPRAAIWAIARPVEAAWRLAGRRTAPPLHRYSLAHVAWDHVLDITEAHQRLGYDPQVGYPESFATITVK
ncbi:MAG: NAD(P)-dependent oxidoreductase [Thermoleophilia bacterium]|nr:NAD(P)-dependent oxidoreductase [Thermoleophilia bacterium]